MKRVVWLILLSICAVSSYSQETDNPLVKNLQLIKAQQGDSIAREFLGNFLCLVNQQLTRAACSKDTNEKQNVPKSFLCCFLGTKVQIFRETTKSS